MSIQAMNDVIKYSKEKGSNLLLLIILANYADDHRLCWPSIATIAKETRMSERQTKRNIMATHKYNHSNELCVIPQGARMYDRAANYKRCNLYSILAGLPEITKIHRKVWSFQNFWIEHHEGENSDNMTPYLSNAYDKFISEYEAMIDYLISTKWHKKGDIFHAKGDIAASPEPLKNPLFKYITTKYIYHQDNRLRVYI